MTGRQEMWVNRLPDGALDTAVTVASVDVESQALDGINGVANFAGLIEAKLCRHLGLSREEADIQWSGLVGAIYVPIPDGVPPSEAATAHPRMRCTVARHHTPVFDLSCIKPDDIEVRLYTAEEAEAAGLNQPTEPATGWARTGDQQ